MICGDCSSWKMARSPLKAHGMALCDHERPPFVGARTYAAHAPCNCGKFKPASPATIERRRVALRGDHGDE